MEQQGLAHVWNSKLCSHTGDADRRLSWKIMGQPAWSTQCSGKREILPQKDPASEDEKQYPRLSSDLCTTHAPHTQTWILHTYAKTTNNILNELKCMEGHRLAPTSTGAGLTNRTAQLSAQVEPHRLTPRTKPSPKFGAADYLFTTLSAHPSDGHSGVYFTLTGQSGPAGSWTSPGQENPGASPALMDPQGGSLG